MVPARIPNFSDTVVLGTRFTIERVKIGHSLPKAARACALLGDRVIARVTEEFVKLKKELGEP